MSGPDSWELTFWIVGLLGVGGVLGALALGSLLILMLRSGTEIVMRFKPKEKEEEE